MTDPSRQGQSDANQNKGPAQTHTWHHADAERYNAAYKQQQDRNNSGKK